MTKGKEQPVCNRCGSEGVLADAYASWNFETQEWEISQAFDKNAFCPGCDGETKSGRGMTPLDAREWLEAERIAGNPFAGELLEMVACEPETIENAEAIEDLAALAPEPLNGSPDRWRLVEWITDRLRLLDDVETLLQDHASDVTAPNGMPHKDAADWLEAVFQSPRWQQFDL